MADAGDELPPELICDDVARLTLLGVLDVNLVELGSVLGDFFEGGAGPSHDEFGSRNRASRVAVR